ncbi:MAG TPA: prepilin peptidase [Thermosulfurimonas dismutans]|uniref:Prepilin leader peptidase/N-methyltransferase n=1 Tax=Thermosulfurimonas dismutans TaxID=999894 RepID=A0A7C3GRY0_9BACT|nr:prepilin peptidase [Thermosulfurimonas dismutans]
MTPFLLLAFLVGLCVGSFLNVVIYRLPRGLSIVAPRSFCPGCGRPLRWFENIPLLSFLWLRGRCRTCRKPISWRYPLVEGLCGVMAVYFLKNYGISIQAAIPYLLTLLLIAASFIDLEHGIIPDQITLGGLLAGLGLSPFSPFLSPREALVGAFCGAGAFYLLGAYYFWIRGREGLGEGDYKLLAMIGGFLGPLNLIPIVFLASVWGLFITLLVALVRRERLSGGKSLPFGPFLSLGAITLLIYPKVATFLFPPIY